MAPRPTTPKVETPVVSVTVQCMVKSIQVYQSGDTGIRYRVAIDKMIDAIKKDADDNYVEAQVDYIDFVPSVLIAQCINHVPGLDIMYTKKKEQAIRADNGSVFGAAELQVVLRDAKLDIVRTKFEAGSEYTNKAGEVLTHENNGYNTEISKIKLSDKMVAKLDKLMDDILGF